MAEYTFNPATAPHRPIIAAAINAHLPALHRRLRQRQINAFIDELVAMERNPAVFAIEPPQLLALLCDRAAQIAAIAEGQRESLARNFTLYAQRFGKADPLEQAQLIETYLRDTVQAPNALRADVAAMRRHLGFDALRERNLALMLDRTIATELGLWFLAQALPEVRKDADAAAQLQASRLLKLASNQLDSAVRWQVRWAAGHALEGCIGLINDRSNAVTTDASIDQLLTTLDDVIGRQDEHPWVQAAALYCASALSPAAAIRRCEASLNATTGAFDMYRRKLILRHVSKTVPIETAVEIITSRIQAVDDSEHVRLGAVEFAADMLRQLTATPTSIAAHTLASNYLIAMTTMQEPSFRVRAKAAIVLAALARDAVPAVVRELIVATLVEATGDSVPFTANVACDELAALADHWAAHDQPYLSAAAPAWLDALHIQLRAPGIAPHSAESISACAEHIHHAADPQKRELLRTIESALQTVAPGQRTVVQLDELAGVINPDEVARGLGELTRRNWGVSAKLRGHRLTVWRGDRFRRRFWRIVHELRNPLPNKRQAFWHTIGRTYPGPMRAHPGLLDEATATTVPGERVTVDSEGSWGRHLPPVDDALDAATATHPITVASSYGLTTLQPPASRWQRMRNRVVLAWRYRELAATRLSSLGTYRDRFRRRYVEELRQRYGVTVSFTPHERNHDAPIPRDVADLFEATTITIAESSEATLPPGITNTAPTLALAVPLVGGAVDWLRNNESYLRSPTQNSQAALVAFGIGMTALFFGRAWQKRRQVDDARAGIPMTIGGWGTRGKSGTERLKAGMFDGLGFDVFVKTTGCEAMFIHSAPMQQPVEIFIYRPYDKATIWEQKSLLELAARFRTQVMMWECMALNPKYVQLLQHEWMNDDVVTLTNCYPDHEDIQGPAGFNVAQVITEFIPTKSTLITSEATYLPMFEQVAARRGTTMYTVGEREAELIGDDALNLFPYREHPRNIALVTRMAEHLDIETDLARLTMAQYVVPDLGVLKAYPPATVRGRKLTFVCGNSANERTGFINNWRRMKLDQLDLDADPEKLVITVVNNRADRISRSEVFARILVRDVAFDRHVLIGTNLEGLQGFLANALDTYLVEQSLVEADELKAGDVAPAVAARIAREFGNLRIPRPVAGEVLRRLQLFGRAANLTLDDSQRASLTVRLDDLFAATGSFDFAAVQAATEADAALKQALADALVAAPDAAASLGSESLDAATLDDILNHLLYDVARMQIRARLETAARTMFATADQSVRQRFVDDFKAAYRAMFMSQVIVIEDAGASGDQIIDRCARCVPPGCDVVLMGTQNIKGTGLDFVYRWLAMDKVVVCLKDIDHPRAERRGAAMAELESFEDYGMIDTGLLRAVLAKDAPDYISDDDRAARARIAAKADVIWQKRRAALIEQKKAGWLDRVANFAEGALDWGDSVRRARGAKQILDDLVAQRMTHAKASVEMRKLVGRVKGGWLAKSLKKRSGG